MVCDNHRHRSTIHGAIHFKEPKITISKLPHEEDKQEPIKLIDPSFSKPPSRLDSGTTEKE